MSHNKESIKIYVSEVEKKDIIIRNLEERVKKYMAKYPNGANGCACLFDDNDNIIQSCSYHKESKKVWIVVVLSSEELLTYKEKYKVFAEDKKEKALEWAKQCGYESMMDVDDRIGMFNFCKYGEVEIGIMHVEIDSKG